MRRPADISLDSEAAAWIGLNLVPEVGPIRFQRLLERFGSARKTLAAPVGALERVEGIGPLVAANIAAAAGTAGRQRLKDEFDKLNRHPDVRLLLHGDPDYPPPLKDLHDPPMVLYLRGEWTEADRLAAAVVGTRRPSSYGEALAARLGKGLAEVGVTVVSGCATGIDLAAQNAALAAEGRVLGVLGCGLDRVFPPEARQTYEKIAGQGALISEFPLGTEPQAQNFPRRNRIIAALSLGTVVVEAPEKSGALITARYAAELGREVMACPGNAIRSSTRGSHALLRDGAGFVEDVEDVLRVIGHAVSTGPPEQAVRSVPQLPPAEERLLGLLSPEPLHLDELRQRFGEDGGKLMQLLLTLELKGLAEQLPGMYYRRPF